MDVYMPYRNAQRANYYPLIASNYQLRGLGAVTDPIEAPEFIEKMGTWGKLGVGALAGAVVGLGLGYYLYKK